MTKTLALFVSDPEGADRELRALGCHVAVRLPGDLAVVRVPDSFEPQSAKGVQPADKAMLDEKGARSLRAFQRSRAILADTPPGHGLAWNAPGHAAPDLFRKPVEQEEERGEPQSTSLAMNRGIAVGLVIVSGPESEDLKFSDDEIDEVIGQCLSGVDFLSAANPEAKIRFTIEVNTVSITAKPLDQSCGKTYDPCEAVFRDPALAILGYTPSAEGTDEYARELQSQHGESWGYVAYFTKYPTAAYAYALRSRVVMDYASDNWGTGNIHRVFAHESCHLFGALDEYDPCTCGEGSGILNAPNNNCVNCEGTHLSCLMDEDTLALCTWSRRQIGWNAWSAQTNVKQVNDAQSSSAPALATFGNNVWMAFKGKDSERLYVCSYDGKTWSAHTSITDQTDALSSTGPALAAFNGKLWMVFKGRGSATLYACSSDDGTTWSNPTDITEQNDAKSSKTPALAVHNGVLWMAFHGETSSNLWVCSFDGATWGPQTNLKDVNDAQTSDTPALVSFGGKLWLVFRGADSSTMHSCTYDGATWSGQTNITSLNGAVTSDGPRIGVLGGLLWLVYHGDGSTNIWYCAFDGTNWLAETQVTKQNDAKTSTSVALAPLSNNKLVAAYRGESSDNLWSMYLEPDANV